jgi:hypothetical protein
MQKRGQAAMEFLSVYAFIFLMMIPLIIIFMVEYDDMRDSLASNQIKNLAIKMVDKAESVYYQGPPSKTTLRVYFPDGLHNITLSNRELVFRYRTHSNNIQEIFFTSQVNISGSLTPAQGLHDIIIESQGDYVSLTG